MADVKISALPTGSVANTDLFPVVKSGVTTGVTFGHTHPISDVTAKIAQQLFETTTAVGITGGNTNEQTLHSFTVPGGTLVNLNDAIRIRSFVQVTNNNNTKRLRIYFGSTVVGDSTLQTFQNVAFYLEAWIWRLTGTTQTAIVWAIQPNLNASWAVAAGGGFNTTSPAETLSGSILVKITGQSPGGGGGNDVQALVTTIDLVPAA